MKFTIITVVFNNRFTIEDAIKSVLNQTGVDIEYIIIDGGSKDGTIEIVNKYIKLISKFISESDSGIYDAMNKGLKYATGDIIGFLNSDDIFENNQVLSLIHDQLLHNKLDGLYGDLVYVKKENIQEVIREWKSKNYYNNFFEDGNVPPHPSLYLRKSVYDKIGGFNINFKLASDYDFMLRVFKAQMFNIIYVPKCLVRMRLGGATNQNFRNIYLGNLEILKSWKLGKHKIPFLLMPKRLIKRLQQFL
jgi:glycosyltransferase involved in cell wall biosynthesis